MPPTNAELAAENAKLSAEVEKLKGQLDAAREVEPDASAADVEKLKTAQEAAEAESKMLRDELDKTREQRDRALEQASGASQNAEAVHEVQHHSGAVLNPSGQDTVPTETPLAPGAADLQLDSEPCTEHYPKGWPAEEQGAAVSCEHGRWIYGQTPKTKPQG